jgi:hypothetical protein
MLRHAVLVRTEVSEVRIASIIRVTGSGELGTTLAVTSNRRSVRRLLVMANVPSPLVLVTLMMEAIRPSETSVLTRTAWRNIPEDGIPLSCLFPLCLLFDPEDGGDMYP